MSRLAYYRNNEFPQFPNIGKMISYSGDITVPCGTVNTKGSWTELVTSTSDTCSFLDISAENMSGASSIDSGLFDLGIGAAASEVVVIPNFSFSQMTFNGAFHSILFPIRINKNTRIAMRGQTSQGAVQNPKIRIRLFKGFPENIGPSKLVNLGADTATSAGVVVTTDNTWTEVVAATTQPFYALIPNIGMRDNNVTGGNQRVSFGIGPAGSEVPIFETFCMYSVNEWYAPKTTQMPIVGPYPKGTRLSAKASGGATDNMAFSFIGIPQFGGVL